MNNEIIKFINEPELASAMLTITRVAPIHDNNAKNLEVAKVYNQITKELKEILSRLNHPEARTYMITYSPCEEDSPKNHVVYEFICILCELTYSVVGEFRTIELNTDVEIQRWIGKYNYDQLLRTVYRNTMQEFTRYNIEDCLQVNTEKCDHYDYFIKRLKEGETIDSAIFIEPAINPLEDDLI